jgi:hypothetical protein
MRIEPDSLPYVRQLPTEKAVAIQQSLHPLLEEPPKPYFRLRWDEGQRLWTSEIVPPLELPPELREVFERTGPGCVPTETNLGVVHVCHAADQAIAGFANRPALYQWQLALMPTAPVLQLRISILDQPDNPYKFESFLNVGRKDDARVLIRLISQAEFYLAFHGDDFTHRFTKVIEQGAPPEQLRQLANQAMITAPLPKLSVTCGRPNFSTFPLCPCHLPPFRWVYGCDEKTEARNYFTRRRRQGKVSRSSSKVAYRLMAIADFILKLSGSHYHCSAEEAVRPSRGKGPIWAVSIEQEGECLNVWPISSSLTQTGNVVALSDLLEIKIPNGVGGVNQAAGSQFEGRGRGKNPATQRLGGSLSHVSQ